MIGLPYGHRDMPLSREGGAPYRGSSRSPRGGPTAWVALMVSECWPLLLVHEWEEENEGCFFFSNIKIS